MAVGAVAGGLLAGPPGAVVGGVVGATAGVALCVLTDLCDWNESGESEFLAPGKPGEDDGFIPPKKPPKNCDPSGRVKNPNGSGKGWEDHIGEVWVPTGGKADHGGDHWDGQTPKQPGQRRGRYRNVYPGGKVRK
ncbi:hypothetical protein AB4176_11005 [Vibrio splendidus]